MLQRRYAHVYVVLLLCASTFNELQKVQQYALPKLLLDTYTVKWSHKWVQSIILVIFSLLACITVWFNIILACTLSHLICCF